MEFENLSVGNIFDCTFFGPHNQNGLYVLLFGVCGERGVEVNV